MAGRAAFGQVTGGRKRRRKVPRARSPANASNASRAWPWRPLEWCAAGICSSDGAAAVRRARAASTTACRTAVGLVAVGVADGGGGGGVTAGVAAEGGVVARAVAAARAAAVGGRSE